MASLALAVQPPDLAAQVQALLANLPTLPADKLSFATSLINQFESKRKLFPNGQYLSDNQIPHVTKLLALATGQPLPSRTAAVGDFGGVIALFKTAGANLKHPKIRLQVDGVGIALSVAGEKSKAPGSINVAGEGRWSPERPWYGRVSPEGVFDPARSLTPAFASALIPVLQELATDPVAAVQRYGRLTGHCMFCAKPLTSEDGRSQAAGFGEKCAKNYGLHEQWKQATK